LPYSQGREDGKASKLKKSSVALESVNKPSSKRSKDIAGSSSGSGLGQKSVENRLIQLAMTVTTPGQTADVKDTTSRGGAGKAEVAGQPQSTFQNIYHSPIKP